MSERVTPRAGAGSGMPGNGARAVMSGFSHRDRLVMVHSTRSDVPPSDDILANRHDAIYWDARSRVREVA